ALNHVPVAGSCRNRSDRPSALRSTTKRCQPAHHEPLAYTFGMLKILELRAKAESRLGTRFDIKAFHEAVLRNGPLPLDLLDREVTAWIAATAR
ncbi:MAG: DUF885 family protein, partial [Candidatus Limnocylindrales bacterium]